MPDLGKPTLARKPLIWFFLIEQVQAMDRHSLRDRAARQFDSERIVDSIITAVNKARLGGCIEVDPGFRTSC